MTNPADHRTTKALEEGQQRSREIAVAPARASARVVVVAFCRRHKWKIVAALFLILTELCLTFLGGTLVKGPG